MQQTELCKELRELRLRTLHVRELAEGSPFRETIENGVQELQRALDMMQMLAHTGCEHDDER